MSYTNLVLHTVTKAGVDHALSRRTIENSLTVENEGLISELLTIKLVHKPLYSLFYVFQ